MLTYLRSATHLVRNFAFFPKVSAPSSPASKAMSKREKRHSCPTSPSPAPSPEGRKGLRSWKSLENMCGTISPVRGDVGVVRTLEILSGAFAELVWWLGLPGKWFMMAIRLVAFAVVMLRAFIPVLLRYLSCPWTFKNVKYVPRSGEIGETGGKVGSIRHQLDLYCPRGSLQGDPKDGPKHPVVIFVSGGAWIIGYKLWSFLMGTVFQDNGIVFISPDYRNFPQGRAEDMVEDISKAVQWTLDHVEHYGGDPNNVTLMGQSAGAHISSIAVINAAEKEARGEKVDFSAKSLVRWVGLSGPYDITSLIPEMHRRGLHRRILHRIFNDTTAHSATSRVQAMSPEALALLPPISLFHGTADRTCPAAQTVGLAEVLRARNVVLEKVKLYEGKSHTDSILEDPAAGSDPLTMDLLELIHPPSSQDSQPAILPPMLPAWQVALARWLNPF